MTLKGTLETLKFIIREFEAVKNRYLFVYSFNILINKYHVNVYKTP